MLWEKKFVKINQALIPCLPVPQGYLTDLVNHAGENLRAGHIKTAYVQRPGRNTKSQLHL